MKNKYFYIKISFIAIILLSIVLWGLFFLIPTNKYIYDSNKKIKELKRIVAKYRRDNSKFNRTNVFEKKILQNLSKQFEDKFYKVENKEDMIKFFRKIYDHIQYYEKKKGDKIIDLQITTEVEKKFPGSNRGMNNQDNIKSKDPLLNMIPKLETKTINLIFSGHIKDKLNFTNHITWSNLFISIKELNISKVFTLTIKVYYINNRIKKNEQ